MNKKDINLNIRIDKETHRKLLVESNKKYMPISEIVRKAIDQFLDK